MRETAGKLGEDVAKQAGQEEGASCATTPREDDSRSYDRRRATDDEATKKSLRWCRTASGLLLLGAGLGLGSLAAFTGHLPAKVYLGGFSAALLLLVAGVVVLQWLGRIEVRALLRRYRRVEQLAELSSAIIGSFAMAVDAKDQHTHGHTERVKNLAMMIGGEMGLDENQLEALKMAAMLHDIGKLAVPDHILSKPDRLTEDEMKKVKTHTLVAAALLETVRFPWPVVPIIQSHHESFDGTGYPDAVAGDKIPLGARILAVADVYDALLSHRPYRPAMGVQEAVAFMRDRSGTQFDPAVLEVCFRVLSEKRAQNRFGFIFDGDAVNPARGVGGDPDRPAVFMDIKQAHQELLALYEILETVSQSLNVHETLDLVLEKTGRVIDFSTCVLFLREPDDEHIAVVTAKGPQAEVIRGRQMALGEGVSGMVAQTGEPSGLGRSATDDLVHLLGPAAPESGILEALSVPLGVGGACIGALTLYRSGETPFTEDDARLAGAVARQTAIAIKNAGQFEQTRKSALTDQLTGLANARYFFMHIEQELSRARREQKPVSLVAIDMDNLKAVNDTFGHQQGDRVLRIFADILRRQVRNYDTVVRYAGDEFFIILPDTTNQLAVETVNRIKQAVRRTTVEMEPGRSATLSASFGIATFPGDAKEADGLIAVADRAMYADKRLNQQAAMLRAKKPSESETVEVDATHSEVTDAETASVRSKK